MLRWDFQKKLNSRDSSFEVNLTPADLITMTLSGVDLRTLGLSEKNLLPVLKEVSNISSGELSLEDVLMMRTPSKAKKGYKIDVLDFEVIARSMGRKDISKLLKQNVARPLFVDKKFLKNNGISDKDFSSLSFSYLVLSKIKLNKEDLQKIDVDERVINLCHKNIVRLLFQKYVEKINSARAMECPLKGYCRDFFTKASDRGFNSYSCYGCSVYKLERHLQLQGYFRELEIGSYGVAEEGFEV